jgi:sortase A
VLARGRLIVVAMAGTVCAVLSPTAASAAEQASAPCTVAVSIPAIGVREELRYYSGSPDDGRGTRIQNTGDLASPLGDGGGVRAGEVGNHFIAGHRTSAGAPLLHIRRLRPGDAVVVRTRCAGGPATTHTYTVTARARYVDFFTRQGRAAQIAPVPFQPGAPPTQAMVTLSTCATQEDKARGDLRKDRFGNPPGRWVVVGVLESDPTE